MTQGHGYITFQLAVDETGLSVSLSPIWLTVNVFRAVAATRRAA